MYMKFHESDFCKSIFAEEYFSKSLVPFGIWGQRYCVGCLIEKPVPPKLEEKCGKGSPSFAFVASLEEKRTFVVHTLSFLGAVCSKYSKDFAPTNPSSTSSLVLMPAEAGWHLQRWRPWTTMVTPYPAGSKQPISTWVFWSCYTERGYFIKLRAAGNYLTLGRGGVWPAEANGSSPRLCWWCEAGKDHQEIPELWNYQATFKQNRA